MNNHSTSSLYLPGPCRPLVVPVRASASFLRASYPSAFRLDPLCSLLLEEDCQRPWYPLRVLHPRHGDEHLHSPKEPPRAPPQSSQWEARVVSPKPLHCRRSPILDKMSRMLENFPPRSQARGLGKDRLVDLCDPLLSSCVGKYYPSLFSRRGN